MVEVEGGKKKWVVDGEGGDERSVEGGGGGGEGEEVEDEEDVEEVGDKSDV